MESDEIVSRCQDILDYRFLNPQLLKEALTHASIADDRRDSNERLEFLGDSVLGLVICHRLFELFPLYLEGDLTKLKSAVVSRNTCAAVSNGLGLTELIFVGKGMTGRAQRPSSLAAGVLESIIAAIYIDGGFEAARVFILRVMEPYIAQYAATTHQQNYKSLLQQHAQQALAPPRCMKSSTKKVPIIPSFSRCAWCWARKPSAAPGVRPRNRPSNAPRRSPWKSSACWRGEEPLPSEVAAAESGEVEEGANGGSIANGSANGSAGAPIAPSAPAAPPLSHDGPVKEP